VKILIAVKIFLIINISFINLLYLLVYNHDKLSKYYSCDILFFFKMIVIVISIEFMEKYQIWLWEVMMIWLI